MMPVLSLRDRAARAARLTICLAWLGLLIAPTTARAQFGQPVRPTPRPAVPTPPVTSIAPADTQTLDPNKIPGDFHPAPPPRPETTINTEWNHPEVRALAPNLTRLHPQGVSLRSKGGPLTDEEKKIVRVFTLKKLTEFTLQANRDNVAGVRDTLVKQDYGTAARARVLDARDVMIKAIVEDGRELLKQHLVCRLNYLMLLADINEMEVSLKRPPLEKTLAPFIEVLGDNSQSDAVRLMAAKGLIPVLQIPELPAKQRHQVTDVVKAAVDGSRDNHFALQLRLVEALGNIDAVVDAVRQPVVPQTLLEVMCDNKRSWLVRAEAAQALGRVPYDKERSVKVDGQVLTYALGTFAVDMAKARSSRPEIPEWKVGFLKLYLAFRDETDRARPAGLQVMSEDRKNVMNNFKTPIEQMANLILPVVQSVVDGKEIVTGDLEQWLQANKPAVLKINPAMAPIRGLSDASATSDTGNGSEKAPSSVTKS